MRARRDERSRRWRDEGERGRRCRENEMMSGR